MNIFVLNSDPKLAAQQHLDKHVVKMPIEYAQLLSTAHRLLDGTMTVFEGKHCKPKKFWLLPGEFVEEKEFIDEERHPETGEIVVSRIFKLVIGNPSCYGLSHMNHPSAIWTRESDSNYRWLFRLFQETAAEYRHRYGRSHKTWTDVKDFQSHAPRNIAAGDLTEFRQAMGEEFKVQNDPIAAYQNYYVGAKIGFARWTNRAVPDWFKDRTKETHVERTFSRSNSLA